MISVKQEALETVSIESLMLDNSTLNYLTMWNKTIRVRQQYFLLLNNV